MHIPVLPAIAALALVSVVSATTGAVAGTLVTSADIKNGTIKLADLDKKTVKSLHGETGPAGPAGQAGAAGTNGSALAYGYVNADGSVQASSTKGLVSQPLPPGSGYACLNYTGGTPKVVVASVADGFNASTLWTSTAIFWTSTYCGTDAGSDILVLGFNYNNTQSLPAFDIAVIA